jgi:hypothetical protein
LSFPFDLLAPEEIIPNHVVEKCNLPRITNLSKPLYYLVGSSELPQINHSPLVSKRKYDNLYFLADVCHQLTSSPNNNTAIQTTASPSPPASLKWVKEDGCFFKHSFRQQLNISYHK